MTTRRVDRRSGRSPERLLSACARTGRQAGGGAAAVDLRSLDADDISALAAADLIASRNDGQWQLTDCGQSLLARTTLARLGGAIDPFRAQHLGLARHCIGVGEGERVLTVDQAESPLAWLARRKGKDGKAHIEPAQLQAGERLRADFTGAQMMPRVTANWESPVANNARGGALGTFSDAAIAARQRVRHALDAVGPEFAGLLIDVCCFLKRLEDVERERGWPPRSAKVVLQLALDRLARHYGYGGVARGPARAAIRTWLAPGADFVVDSS
jgi:hypothetical protein